MKLRMGILKELEEAKKELPQVKKEIDQLKKQHKKYDILISELIYQLRAPVLDEWVRMIER